jgi:hypothetical protein
MIDDQYINLGGLVMINIIFKIMSLEIDYCHLLLPNTKTVILRVPTGQVGERLSARQNTMVAIQVSR